MKKAEQYLEDVINQLHDSDQPWFTDNVYDGGSGPIMEAIKQAQIDAIEETVKLCAKNAYCDLIHPPDEDYPDLEESEYLVVKQSILNCAEILKKQL